MILFLLLLSLPGRAADNRALVSFLPVEGPPDISKSIESAMKSSCPESFTLIPLNSAQYKLHSEHTDCRRQPLCLADNIPAGPDFVIDTRIAEHNGGLVLDMRLLRAGKQIDRHSIFLENRIAAKQVSRELETLLKGKDLASQLYMQAILGNGQAGELLLGRYPENPLSQTLRSKQAALVTKIRAAQTKVIEEKQVEKTPSEPELKWEKADSDKQNPSLNQQIQNDFGRAKSNGADRRAGHDAGSQRVLSLQTKGYRLRIFDPVPKNPPPGPWTSKSKAYQKGYREGYKETAKVVLGLKRGAFGFVVLLLLVTSG